MKTHLAFPRTSLASHHVSRRAGSHRVRRRNASGFVLVVALLLLVAATLLTLSTMQSGLFQERMGAVDRDRVVAVSAGEAALQDAERDIMGIRSVAKSNAAYDCFAPGHACRFPVGSQRRLGGSQYQDDQGIGLDAISFNNGVRCGRGICDIPDPSLAAPTDTKAWKLNNVWTTLTSPGVDGLAVKFGAYTGATPVVDSRGVALTSQPAYIIETIKAAQDSVLQSLAYRITARGYGVNPRTTVLVQSTFVMPPPGNDDLIAACERQLLRDAGAGETGANDDPARNRFHHN